jgi:hypothetical protein
MNAVSFSRIIPVIIAVCLLASCTAPQPGPPLQPSGSSLRGIAPEDAINHIGQTQTVCGIVASAKYAAGRKSKPTFLNLNRPYPDQIFTVLIWGRDRPKFSEPPEEFYPGKQICVTGRIVKYRGKPQIVVEDPSQLVVSE